MPEPSSPRDIKSEKGKEKSSHDGRTAAGESRAGSRGGMKRSESDILNDHDIWNVSSSSDSEDAGDGTSSKEKSDRDSDDDDLSETQTAKDSQSDLDTEEMARYLIE